jgi:hypothetical protein
MNEPRLKLETQEGAIVISLPGTSYEVTFRKLADGPGISASHNIQDDEDASITLLEFLDRASGVPFRQDRGCVGSGSLGQHRKVRIIRTYSGASVFRFRLDCRSRVIRSFQFERVNLSSVCKQSMHRLYSCSRLLR